MGGGFSFRITKSFSKGVKFRSRHKARRLLIVDKPCEEAKLRGLVAEPCEEAKLRGLVAEPCEEVKLRGPCMFSVRFKGTWLSFKAVLCLLMWPPKAWPIANSRPQTEHSCVLGLGGEPCDWESRLPCSPPINLGFLWLARWPPSAWNDENCRLQVLHSKTRLGELEKASISLPRESSIKQFATVTLWSNSLSLFIMAQKTKTKTQTGFFEKSSYVWKGFRVFGVKNKSSFCLTQRTEWNLTSLWAIHIYRVGWFFFQ